MSLLIGSKLSLGYEGKEVIGNINFTVNSGDYLCIVGENGAGKTTLMKTILRLISPLGGEITLGDGLRRNEIGYLPQQTEIQRDFPASVTEIVRSGCQGSRGMRPFYSRAERDRVRANMERMGIQGLAKRCYRDLSGGQQQRVLLARALCATQKILLLDEPVTGLDPKVASEFYDIVRNLNREGVTIIMITHDINAAVRYATHVLHVDRNPFFGTRDEYLQSETGRRFMLLQSKEEEN